MNRHDLQIRQNLEKEVPLLRAQIQALYQKLDKEFGLHAAAVPITFGFDEDTLGSYTRESNEEREHFHFSLFFVGYCVENPLLAEDRQDLYLHEYAHYMQYHMEIPREYEWKGGAHGSAWKYCCSLVGAAPTPYYRVGESLQKHDYEKINKNPWKDPNYALLDTYHREKEYQKNKNQLVQYEIGEAVHHPKFGHGVVENYKQMDGSVRLYIRFGEEQKIIDQKWMLRTKYKRMKDR